MQLSSFLALWLAIATASEAGHQNGQDHGPSSPPSSAANSAAGGDRHQSASSRDSSLGGTAKQDRVEFADALGQALADKFSKLGAADLDATKLKTSLEEATDHIKQLVKLDYQVEIKADQVSSSASGDKHKITIAIKPEATGTAEFSFTKDNKTLTVEFAVLVDAVPAKNQQIADKLKSALEHMCSQASANDTAKAAS